MFKRDFLGALALLLINTSVFAVQQDFDGDNVADLGVMRSSNGFHYLLNSSGSNFGSERGDGIQRHRLSVNHSDIPIVGDFDGDGIWDIGVRRPASYEWIIRKSSGGELETRVFGRHPLDIPVPADYDGDGITDVAVRRPSTGYWYIANSSGVDLITGHSDGVTRLKFGLNSADIPVPADYDGDGRADPAVRRPGNQVWYILNSAGQDLITSNRDGISRKRFGLQSGDVPVPADYDGDGKADLAVWRPSKNLWYVLNSSGVDLISSSADGITRKSFGDTESAIPVVADYDGDGRDDIAIRRPQSLSWLILNSSGVDNRSGHDNGVSNVRFGLRETDIPLSQQPYLLFYRFDIDGDGYSYSEEIAMGTDPLTPDNVDSDGDGVIDDEDAFPDDPSETTDSDGDGTGDNADDFPHDAGETTDSDGDGIGDNSDAFPSDPTETQDTDSDGTGDNSDFYPTDAGCASEDAGDGEHCYATLILELSNLSVENDANNQVFFSLAALDSIVSFNLDSNQFTRVSMASDNNENLNVMAVSEVHNRLYLGFSTGRIAYIDLTELTLNEFSSASEAVYGLAAVGNYILAQDNSGAWESHYIFDVNGNQTDWKEWNHYSRVYAWNNTLERVYFFRDTSSPNDLMYEDIDQASGIITADDDSPYHGDFSIAPPIIVSPYDDQVLLGSGDIYDAQTLEHQGSIGFAFHQGYWTADSGLVIFQQQGNSFLLTRFNDGFAVVEQTRFSGELLDVVSQTEKAVLVVEMNNTISYIDYIADDDIDDDGVDNLEDAFPEDAAASVDTDNDGAPDSWNDGYSEAESTTGLQLDVFPTESSCWLESHAEEGNCDPNQRLVFGEAQSSQLYDGILYVLSPEDRRINRSEVSSSTYLNPILLSNNDVYGQPLTVAVGGDLGVLVGYDSGNILRYSLDGLGTPIVFGRLANEVHQVFVAGEQAIAIYGSGNYYRNYAVLDENGQVVSTYTNGDYSNDYEFNYNSNRLYWFSNSYSDYLYSALLSSTGTLTEIHSRRYNSNPTSFMSVSGDDSRIVTSENITVADYYGDPVVASLARPTGLTDSAVLQDFIWLNEIAVGLYSSGGRKSYLAIYSPDLSIAYSFVEMDSKIIALFSSNGLLVTLTEELGSFDIQNVPLEADGDQDGIPHWWEASYGLNDANVDDAGADPDLDGLTNLQEYTALTDPNLADTDGDGLNDGQEVLEWGLNPLSVDTDQDLLPDAWEVQNGLNGNDSSDAAQDSDNDGVSNYHEYLTGTDPQDASSIPDFISNELFSFEGYEAPQDWLIEGDYSFTESEAFHGNVSLLSHENFSIEWQGLFSNTEVDFYLYSDCYSSYDKSYNLYIDDELLSYGYIAQLSWNKVSALITMGYQSIRLEVESSDSSCGLYLDAVTAKPMRNLFEMGANFVTQRDGTLNIYDYHGELLRTLIVPGVFDSYRDARDISVLDDGRIAVFNGTFRPVLSIYSPQENSWEYIKAPAWSTVNNGSYGGIDAIGNKVFVTNMSTSGSETQGIILFDLTDNSVTYHDGPDLTDLNVGLDGNLYALGDRTVYQYNPQSLELLNSISIDESRSIAVDALGYIYAASWSSEITQYDQSGNEIKSLFNSDNASYNDIALRVNGEIRAAEAWYGKVYQTSTELISITQIPLNAEFIDFVPDIDSDADGLPDWWEGGFGLDANNADDAASDPDNDGLTALQEYQLGTEENNADTDGDGLEDGFEYNTFGSEPTVADSDADGLNDGEEYEQGTNPLSRDSDSDGLSDTEELNTYGTNPLAADSDMDGMNDLYEVIHGLDANAVDSDLDADGDGLTNLQEHDVGSDPNLADSDGDTLSDFDELMTYLTSPILADTDSDQLPDAWEIQFAMDPLDPENATLDIDGDLFSALEEFYSNTDPTNNSNFPEPINWGTNQGDERHTGYTPHILDANDFALKWQATLPWGSLLPVATSETMVFVSADSYFGEHGIAGLDAESGEISWQLDYDGIHSVNAPAYQDGQVYFQTGGHSDSFIRSVDAATGTLNFESSYGNQWSRYLAPTIFDGNVYMAGGYYGGTYGFDGMTGAQLWFAGGPQYDEFTPAVDENYVYAFTTRLDILARETGELINSIAFPGFDWGGYDVGIATILTAQNNVVATQSGTLVVFDTESLSVKWEKSKAGFSEHVAVANGTIYALANGSLYSMSEDNGDNNWILGTYNFSSNIIVTKTHLFVGDSSRTYGINLDSREIEWSYEAAGALSLSKEGMLYISGSTLTAIELK